MGHRVYGAIVGAVKLGALHEPFTRADFRHACPGFAPGTYNVFLNKHCVGNPGGNTELFVRESTDQFRCVRPFFYGF